MTAQGLDYQGRVGSSGMMNVIAREVGTPAYVYDLAELRLAAADLGEMLPTGSTTFYSVKANPHPRVIAELASSGCRVEVSSTGELHAAIGAGLPGEVCLYNGPAKSAQEIRIALDAGVRWYSVDSGGQFEMLRKLAEAAGVVVEVLLRVNGDAGVRGQGLAMTGTASQFGIDISTVLGNPTKFARSGSVRIAGLHCYMGTNVADEEALVATFRLVADTARTIAPLLPDGLRVLDLGGGFAAPFARKGSRPDYPSLRRQLDQMKEELPGVPDLWFESGRFLSACAGTLLTRVADVKESKGKTFVMLDSGIHHLGGMSGLRRVPPIMTELVTDASTQGTTVRADVVGPLCTPLDAWARGADVPQVSVGDLLQVPNVGAYGLTGSLLGFLSHPIAPEVIVDRGRIIEVSQLELVRTLRAHQ